jgi:hypothetical protein
VEEIEQAIEKLSDEELAEIRAWLWDRDIERDAAEGRSPSAFNRLCACDPGAPKGRCQPFRTDSTVSPPQLAR